ncbi:MAG: nucleotidyltransferase family protein [Syntrophomonas sp.]
MWQEVVISPDTPIVEAIKIIDHGDLQIALVVNEEGKLLGTITDGDIRRAIMRHLSLDEPVKNIMNKQPRFIYQEESREKAITLMKANKIRQIPVLSQDRRLVGLEIANELLTPPFRNNYVILMAGGLGKRLDPLTKSCPKPLLRVGNKPVLETTLENFVEQGFRQFYISINYKAAMIKEYFGDGSRWGIKIDYLFEKEQLGTAGALGLLPFKPNHSIILMNGDILTKISFGQVLDFHRKNQSDATICIKEQQNQIPYGVVTVAQNKLKEIEEKPIQRFFINAGLYVLNPDVLKYITPGSRFDIPDLFKILLKNGKAITAFPIREYWIDIGRFDDYERANNEFAEVFK